MLTDVIDENPFQSGARLVSEEIKSRWDEGLTGVFFLLCDNHEANQNTTGAAQLSFWFTEQLYVRRKRSMDEASQTFEDASHPRAISIPKPPLFPPETDKIQPCFLISLHHRVSFAKVCLNLFNRRVNL